MTVEVEPAQRQGEPAVSWRALRAKPGDEQAWCELAEFYLGTGLPWHLRYVTRQLGRVASANIPERFLASISGGAEGDEALGRSNLADAEVLTERFSEFAERYPQDWLTWLYLARLHDLGGLRERSQKALERATTLEILPGESRHWLGVWRLSSGDAQGAIEALAPLATNEPPRYGSLMYLGEALLKRGNPAAAEAAFTKSSQSPNPDFLLVLANRVFAQNYWREAMAILQKALQLRPDHVPTLMALARIQSEVYDLDGCRVSLERLAQLVPDNPEVKLLRAGQRGRMGDAQAHFSQLLDQYEASGDPLSRLASSVAMTSLYQDTLSPAEIGALHRRLCAPIESALPRSDQFPNDLSPTRRLRVGYVTGDLYRQHPVNLFLLPVLKRHDRENLEIFIYQTGTMQDDYTRQAMAAATGWRHGTNLDDHALARLVRDDGIDILVDLAGHTSGHRLGLFASRAAPVQATFLGYPFSTGLSTIDWIIGDAVVTPREHAAYYSEGIAQLPGSVFCWAPVDDYPLPPARPAADPVVLGSFNNAMKLSPATIELWSAVLRALPESRLLLKAPSFTDPSVQARFAEMFARLGISAARIEFRGPTGLAEMMGEYGDIDIALDPITYNGGTTTLQALWMGVPVVTLEGGCFVSRMGASFLNCLGKREWIAKDAEDFVCRVKHLADRIEHVRRERSSLREAMLQCRLSDVRAYVPALEALYREMWHRYVTRNPTRLISLEEVSNVRPE